MMKVVYVFFPQGCALLSVLMFNNRKRTASGGRVLLSTCCLDVGLRKERRRREGYQTTVRERSASNMAFNLVPDRPAGLLYKALPASNYGIPLR